MHCSLIALLDLSQPRNLHLEMCTDRAVLTWSQIPEQLDGYCVNYRSLSDGIWHSCCIPSHDRMFSYGITSLCIFALISNLLELYFGYYHFP